MSTFSIYAKGPRAVLMNDTAGIDGDGVVRAWVSKVVTIPHLRMAITTRGAMAALSALATDLAGRFTSFDDMGTTDGADFLQDAHEQHLMNWSDLAGSPEFELALVGWSEKNRRCEAHAISSLDNPGLPAFTFLRQEYLLAPAPTQTDLMSAGLWMNGGLPPGDPAPTLLGIVDLQREMKLPLGGGGLHHIVGGQLVQTEITEAGITQRIVRRWADKLDEPIRPEPRAAAAPPPPGMSRQQRRNAERIAKKGHAHAG